MKKIKLTYYLVMLLSLISLVSVGFASWSVTDDFSTSSSGMIVVEDVLKVNDYITCESYTKFSFFKPGFVDESGNITNQGTITATLKIDVENCIKKFKDCNSLEIDLSLESKELAIFNYATKSTMSVELTCTNFDINAESYIKLDQKEYLTEFDLINFNSVNDDFIIINVTYKFEVLDIDIANEDFYSEYFADNIYRKLLNSSFNFVLSAKLTGKVVE